MGHTVHSLFLSTLKGRKRLLGGPGRGGRLLGHWRGFNEAAVEGVLRVVVGYWEQKTNKAAERSARRRCTTLQEQQFCCHSLFNLLQSLRKRWLCWKPFTADISNFEGWCGPHSSCFYVSGRLSLLKIRETLFSLVLNWRMSLYCHFWSQLAKQEQRWM